LPWSPLGVCFNLSHSARDQIAVGVCAEVAARGAWRGMGAGGLRGSIDQVSHPCLRSSGCCTI